MSMFTTSTGPTGSTSSTAQPTYTPKELGGNFRCFDCGYEPFRSKEELEEHKRTAHKK